MGSCTLSYGQAAGREQITFDVLLSRALRMSDVDLGQLSPRMNHLWMATLVDSLQPSALSELAKTNLRLDNRKEGLRQLLTAFRTSGHDYHLGLMLLQVAGRYQEWGLAQEVTDILLKQKPNDAYLLQLLSAVYEESGQLDRAIETMKKLVEIKDNEPRYVLALANQLLKTNKNDEAEALLTRYQVNRPDELMSSAMLISLWLNEKKYDKANELLKRVKARFPHNPNVLSMTISTYAQQGKNAELCAEILDAAQQEGATPDDMEELIRIASQDSSDLTRLLKELTPLRQKLITIFDHTPQLSLALANHYFLLRDTVAGETVLHDLVGKGVELPSPYAYFLQKYAIKEDSENVQKYTEAGLKAMPEEGLFLFYHALISSTKGDKVEFEKRVNHAIAVASEEDPIYPQLALMKAEIENEHDRWEDAKKYYEISIKRRDPLALNNYAYALVNHGSTEAEYKRAEQLAMQTVKAMPDDPNYLDTYAWVLYKNNALSAAKIYMERAIDKAKSRGEISMSVFYEHYADILTAMGLYEDALKVWRDALESGSEAKAVSNAVERIMKLKDGDNTKSEKDNK